VLIAHAFQVMHYASLLTDRTVVDEQIKAMNSAVRRLCEQGAPARPGPLLLSHCRFKGSILGSPLYGFNLGQAAPAQLAAGCAEALCLEDRGAGRGLYANQRVLGGTVLLSVPWSASLTGRSAVMRLKQLETANQGAKTSGSLSIASFNRNSPCENQDLSPFQPPLVAVLAGLLPKGVGHLRALLTRGDHSLLPPTATWRLMLALQLLAELRDPRSPLAPYARALPAPPGSRIAAVCCGEPADTGLLLFRCFGTVHCVSVYAEGLDKVTTLSCRSITFLYNIFACWC